MGVRVVVSSVEEPIIQDYPRGIEFTIDIFSDFDGKVLASVSRQRLLISSEVTDRGKTLTNPELIEWGKKIAEDLGAIGPINIQGKIDKDEIKLFEINPRFSGGIPLTIKYGPNFPELILRLHKGEKIEPMIGDNNANLVMMCYEAGLFIDEDSVADIKPGKAKIPDYNDMF